MEDQASRQIAKAYGLYSDKYASRLEPFLEPMADTLTRLAKVRSTDSVLDLATGTGLIARMAAHTNASITGIDISFGALTTIKNLSNVKVHLVVGDAHMLPFPDSCFDRVICGLSLSHFSDVPKALIEIFRVLRAKGRFVASAWSEVSNNPSYSAAVEVRRKYFDEENNPYTGALDEELWANVESGSEMLKFAGFDDVQVAVLPLSGKYRDPADAVEMALAWPLTRLQMDSLDSADQVKLIEETYRSIVEVGDLNWKSDINYYQGVKSG